MNSSDISDIESVLFYFIIKSLKIKVWIKIKY